MKLSTVMIAAAVGLAAVTGAAANDITGAGATFPYPIYAKWADAYKKDTGTGINYQSIGSGAGVKQIEARTVTFGATDAPLRPDLLKKHNLVQWPQVMGAIVPIVNLEGIKSNDLVLDGATLADIFLGKIKSWDDAAIKKLNPALALPSAPIAVIRRSDGSGTTYVWTTYLAESSAEWQSKVSAGTAVEWPVGVGARGNEGVAGNVGQTKNAIGYVEYAYAKQNNLTYAALVNKAGKTVKASTAAFQAAAANADWAKAPGYRIILTNQAGDTSWPVTAATFILMPAQPDDKAAAAAALKFFAWAFEKGDKMAEDLDYVPMPDAVVALIKATWDKEIATR